MTTAPSTRPTGTSAESDALRALYADWSDIIATTPDLTMRLFRSIFDEWHQPTREPEDVTYREETVGGVPGIWALPVGADPSQVLLYTHGGGFAVGSASSHRKLAAHVAKALGVTSFVLDYRRAPSTRTPRRWRTASRPSRALTERGIAPADITTIGDSAGGNLAIATALALRDRGWPLPGRVIAFSPWLDMENAGETLVTNDATDALVTVPAARRHDRRRPRGGQIDPKTPLANPLYADFAGLPAALRQRGRGGVPGRQRHPVRRQGPGGRASTSPCRSSTACSTSSRSWPAPRPRPTPRSPRSPSGTAADRDHDPHHSHDPRSTHEHHRTPTSPDVDAIVIGAGFGGIYMLHKLRNELGLTVQAFEKGGGVGGTWYFNRYPGAKSDTEGFVYRYSFDKDLLQEWDWNTRYLDQPDILAYLEHVVDRYDLRRDIQLNTEVTGAVFDDATDLWTVTTDDGKSLTARYLVNALGLLAKSNIPDIPGRDTFAGPLVHTNAWPDDLDITGKRVGVIGTGSTGTQFIVAAAKIADHLTVFQRTPQYCVPSGQRAGRPGRGRPHQGGLRRDLGPGPQLRRRLRVRGERRRGDERLRGGAPPRVPGELGQGQRLPVHVRHVLRHRHQPGGERGRSGVHPLQDRRDRRGPGDRPQAHPDRPLRQAPAVQRGLLRDLQPGQRRAGLDQGEPDRGDHPGRRANGRRRRARTRRPGLRDRVRRGRRQLPVDGPARARRQAHRRALDRGPDQLPGPVEGRLPEHVHDPRPERAFHQPAAEHRDPGRVDRRADRQRRARTVCGRSSRPPRRRTAGRPPARRSRT